MMKKQIAPGSLLLLSIVWALVSGHSFGDTTLSRIQGTLRVVGIAMTMYAKDHEGMLPTSWKDFERYWEVDTVEGTLGQPLESGIKLLTARNVPVNFDGKRLLAISTAPRDDGKFDVLYQLNSTISTDFAYQITLTSNQLREIGLDPPTMFPLSETTESSAELGLNNPSEAVSSLDGVSSNDTPERERANHSSFWLFVVLGIALLVGSVIVIQSSGRTGK